MLSESGCKCEENEVGQDKGVIPVKVSLVIASTAKPAA